VTTAGRYAAQPAAAGVRNGGVSFWYEQIGLPAQRPPLPGDLDADVCIVGAGLTGLWTAYYLKQAAPELRVVVLEREFAGYGASGRNGGWLSAEVAAPAQTYLGTAGRDGVLALHRAMRATVDEVIGVAAREGIDADIVKDGVVFVARNPAQLSRLAAAVELERAWGADATPLSAAEATARIGVDGVLGGMHLPDCARVQPAKLVQGVARAVERLGVEVYEGTTVTAVEQGRAVTDRGTVRAGFVLRCLEGYTSDLPGERRTWLPMNSAIVVTEPLPQDVHDEIGWRGPSCSATWRTRTSTPSAPPTAGSPSAGAASRTATGRDGTSTAAPSRRRSTRSPGCCTSSSRRPAGWPSSTPGAACWRCHGTGRPPCTSTSAPASAGPAATSAAG
jgi:glycine/D-amino acid oxidase-like deaminating enzyme